MGYLKKLLLVGVTVTFTWTAAGAGHNSPPDTQPTISCQVRTV